MQRHDDPRGLNCWGLVRAVLLREAGVMDVPEYDIAACEIVDVEQAVAVARISSRWTQVNDDERRAFDVQVMRDDDGRERHVGVVCGAGWLLHSERRTDACLVRLVDPRVAPRLVAAYRHRELT